MSHVELANPPAHPVAWRCYLHSSPGRVLNVQAKLWFEARAQALLKYTQMGVILAPGDIEVERAE